MRYFVTGASGWIGSATVRELLAAGHQVVGMARSDASAAAIEALGAEARRGDLDDPASLAAGAADADGVVHLAYHHDFSQMTEAAQMDRAAIDAMGAVLAGTDKPLLIASGTIGLAVGRVAREDDRSDPSTHSRIASAEATMALADRGVRSIVVRFAPTVHGTDDHGFVKTLVDVARGRGTAGYIGDGTNRWPAVHVGDAALLVRLAMDGAPAGSVVHATAEEGVTGLAIAEAIGRSLDLPTTSVAAEQAIDHFGWIGMFFGADIPTSSALTQQRLDWHPTGPTLIEDIDGGAYSPR